MSEVQAARDEEMDASTRLVSAVCHEIGNMVAAVRLQAHLLDEELALKQLAVTSVEIDDLTARISAMLALVRPLLRGHPGEPDRARPSSIFAVVSQTLKDAGGRGMTLQVECDEGLPRVIADADVLHHLVLTLVYGAMDAASRKGTVWVRGRLGEPGVCFDVLDDGEEDPQLLDWREPMLRGRPLTCAVADFILRRYGARLEVKREEGLTRVSLLFPV